MRFVFDVSTLYLLKRLRKFYYFSLNFRFVILILSQISPLYNLEYLQKSFFGFCLISRNSFVLFLIFVISFLFSNFYIFSALPGRHDVGQLVSLKNI